MSVCEKNIVLSVKDLNQIYGPGCACCGSSTGPGRGVNICAACGATVALYGISFDLYEGEILGVVGESGSGKSSLVRCLYFDYEPSGGEVYLSHYNDGRYNVLQLPLTKKRNIRNHLMGMVYQNPVMGLRLNISSGGNIAEKLLAAEICHYDTIRQRGKKLLARTEIPAGYMDEKPKRLSGGMQQRVQISKALANNPPLLLLDEVTTGLDVSVQARVLDLIKDLQQELKISMIVVSHDLGVIRLLANRTLVLKNGRIVEQGLTDQILEDPQHPYSQLLVHSML